MRGSVTAWSVIVSAVVVAAGCGGSPGPEATGMDASASADEAGVEDGSLADSGASPGDGAGSSQGDSGSSGSPGDGGGDSDGGTESDSGATGNCPTTPPTSMSPCAPGGATCTYDGYHEFCTCGPNLVWTCNIILAMTTVGVEAVAAPRSNRTNRNP
jgi:hypothetical protein